MDKSEGRGFGGGLRPYGHRPGRGRAVTPSPKIEMKGKKLFRFWTFPSILSVVIIISIIPVVAEDDSSDSEVVKMKEITVTPGKLTIAEGTLLQHFLNKTEIDKLPLIDNDIYRAAHVFPGVTASDFSARFQIRGGDKDETVVILDGMELYEPYHLQDFGGAISIIDLGVIQKAELLMGGFPTEYGDRMSGVFDISAREGSREGFRGNFGIDLVNTHLSLEGPLSNKGSWLFLARRGYIDFILALMDSDEEMNPKYFDLFSKATYSLTPRDKVTVDAMLALDSNLINEQGEQNDLESEYTNGFFWGKWRHNFGEKAFSNLYLFGGGAEQAKKDGVEGKDDREVKYFGVKGNLTLKSLTAHTVKTGFQWRFGTADYEYRENPANTNRLTAASPELIEAQPEGWDMNGFLQDEWQIQKYLAANVGVRAIYQDYSDQFSLSPRIALAARLGDKLVLRGAWGIYRQPITTLNLPVEAGITKLGRPERATHYIIGGEYLPGQNLLLRAEAYYKQLDDLAGVIRDYGRKSQILIQPEKGWAKGFEIFLRQTLSPRLSWYAGYVYAIAKEQAGSLEFPRDFDQRHSLLLNANFALSNNLHLNTSWRFHTGNPYTEIYAEKIGDTCQKRFGNTPNTKRLPAYHSLDVRITRKHPFKSWQLKWYLQILNLYNRSNVHEYALSQTDEAGKLECKIDAEHLLPIIPTFGIQAAW